MTKILWKPGTMLAPVPPALISCGSVEKPNVMTVAWTGIVSSEPPMTYVSIRPSRYSHELIKESGQFVINLTTLPLVTAADFCGVKSGRDIDKFKEMNLTAAPCSEISAPQIAESPVSMECKVVSVESYGTHDMFLAEIVAVNVDDRFIDDKGRLDLEKAGLIAYSHGNYYTLGRNLGSFGFSVNKARLKQMQKMEKVTVEVKEAKIISDAEGESVKRAPKTFEERKRSSTTSRRRDGDGERRPFNSDRPRRDGDGERRPFNSDRPRRDGDGERRSFNSDRPRREGDGERRPFNRDGGERRAPRRDGDGERRSFNSDRPRRDGDGERRPFNSDRPRREGDGERRPYNRDGGERRAPRRDGDGERRPFNSDRPRREGDGERRPYNRDGGDRKPREYNREDRKERTDDKAPRKHYGKSNKED